MSEMNAERVSDRLMEKNIGRCCIFRYGLRIGLSILVSAGMLGAGPARAQEAATEKATAGPALDPATGMVIAPGWELVRNNCITCHSPQQFLRQKGTLATWTEILRWMQKSGGLWALPKEAEETMLNYLAENYGPSGEYRRAPIPATLMPENPYVSEAKKEYEAKVREGTAPGKK